MGEPLALQVMAGTPQHEALNAAALVRQTPMGFVPQTDLPADESYERYIFHSKKCPVRGGTHDFFNGICWLQLPQTKQRLNALHVAELSAQAGKPTLRGPVRDAATVFDENAAFLLAPPAVAAQLWPALLAKDWQRLCVALRPLWQEAQLFLFGHALLEKLVSPRKGVTAHVFVLDVAITSIASLDSLIASALNAAHLSQKPFAPLPVLGVPGWWPANEDPAFYNDPKVFRVAP